MQTPLPREEGLHDAGHEAMKQADVENFSSVAGSVLCGQSLDSLEVLPLPLPSLPLPCKDKLAEDLMPAMLLSARIRSIAESIG